MLATTEGYKNYFFQTGQIKIIDASYSPNQGFVDYQTFQMRQYYGNFVSMKNQFVSFLALNEGDKKLLKVMQNF